MRAADLIVRELSRRGDHRQRATEAQDSSQGQHAKGTKRSARRACAVREFPDEYFRKVDAERGYPEEFVKALTKAGWLAALIPAGVRRIGTGPHRGVGDPGGDQSLRAAIPAPATGRCTSWARCCATARSEQKREYLPKIASGELRLQSFAVTEPTTGTDTTKLKTYAR